MEDNNDYMPHFIDSDGNKWSLSSLNFCMDFGGRQIQFDCFLNGQKGTKTFVYEFKGDSFRQWGASEVMDVDAECLIGSSLHKALYNFFHLFDEGVE